MRCFSHAMSPNSTCLTSSSNSLLWAFWACFAHCSIELAVVRGQEGGHFNGYLGAGLAVG